VLFSKCVSKNSDTIERKDWNGTPCRGERAITKQSYLRFAHYLTRDGSRARDREEKYFTSGNGEKYRDYIAQSFANNILVPVTLSKNFRVSYRRNQSSDRNNYFIRATIVIKGSWKETSDFFTLCIVSQDIFGKWWWNKNRHSIRTRIKREL